MKNKDVIELIRQTYSEKSPNVLSSLRFDRVESAKSVVPPIRRRYYAAIAAYVAACILIVCIIPLITSIEKDQGISPSGNSDPITAITTDDTPVTTDEEKDLLPIQDFDFGGADFKFLHVGDETQYDYWKTSEAYLYAEDIYLVPTDWCGEAISKAVSERNSIVEKEYNINFTSETVEDLANEAITRMQSGQCDFNAILGEGVASTYFVTGLKGYLRDFHQMENMDLTQSYWMPKTAESLTVADRMFFGGGMIAMDAIGHAEMLYFNKTLMNELGYGNNDPIDMVDKGSWTYDRMIEMAVSAEKDLDGDEKITTNDQWHGLSMDYLKGMIINSFPVTNVNEMGEYELVPHTPKTLEVYNKYADTILTLRDSMLYSDATYNAWIDMRFSLGDAFRENRTLFVLGSIDYSRELCNTDTSGYGIVPVPVLEEGDEYVARGDSNSNMISIPIDTPDPYMTGAVLEYMAKLSEEILLPAYTEYTIGTNPIQDERNYAMFDIIKDSVRYDWVELYISGNVYGSYNAYENMRQRIFQSGYTPYDFDHDKIMDPINTVIDRIKKIKY